MDNFFQNPKEGEEIKFQIHSQRILHFSLKIGAFNGSLVWCQLVAEFSINKKENTETVQKASLNNSAQFRLSFKMPKKSILFLLKNI